MRIGRSSWVWLTLLCMAAGCASTGRDVAVRTQRSILFDAAPASIPATEILHHSGWPATAHSGPTFEIVHFTERTIDVQDTRHPRNDRTYRRFDTVRVGRQYR